MVNKERGRLSSEQRGKKGQGREVFDNEERSRLVQRADKTNKITNNGLQWLDDTYLGANASTSTTTSTHQK